MEMEMEKYWPIDIVIGITSPHALISHHNHTTSVYCSLNYFVQRTFNVRKIA